jgi:putative zinc finger protein
VSDHEDIQLELAAYAASRLEGETLRRVEEHLRECAGCGELVHSFRGLAGAMREDGALLFEPHPPGSELRRCARAGETGGPDGVARHLAVCAPCSLEVAALAAAGTGGLRSPSSDVGRTPRWLPLAVASTAGLGAGLGLAVLLRIGGSPPAPPASFATDMPAGAESSGVGPMLILPPSLRSEGTSVTYTLEPRQMFVVVACPAAVPDAAATADLFRYEIRNTAGRVVWSVTMNADEIRRHLAGGAEAVTLLVPSASVAPGRYEFLLSPAGSPGMKLYRAGLELMAPR